MERGAWSVGLWLAGALAVPGAEVTLAWDASPSTNIIANYKIYYGAACATYTNSVSAGTNLTATVSNLVAGCAYYFAATATDREGLESDYSDEVAYVPPGTNQVIQVSAGPRATNIAWAASLRGPWTLLGTTNYWATNPPAPRYYRGIGRAGNRIRIEQRRAG